MVGAPILCEGFGPALSPAPLFLPSLPRPISSGMPRRQSKPNRNNHRPCPHQPPHRGSHSAYQQQPGLDNDGAGQHPQDSVSSEMLHSILMGKRTQHLSKVVAVTDERTVQSAHASRRHESDRLRLRNDHRDRGARHNGVPSEAKPCASEGVSVALTASGQLGNDGSRTSSRTSVSGPPRSKPSRSWPIAKRSRTGQPQPRHGASPIQATHNSCAAGSIA